MKQINLKDVFMQFLLYFNEDFDDDLLLDVIRLLFEWLLINSEWYFLSLYHKWNLKLNDFIRILSVIHIDLNIICLMKKILNIV